MRPGALVLIIAILATFAAPADAWVFIFVDGQWSASIGQSDLAGGAGADFVPSLESAEDVVSVDLYASTDWRLTVERQDVSWPDGVGLSVRATSVAGFGGTATVNEAYTGVSASPVEVANGTRRGFWYTYAGLGFQYRLENLSASMGAAEYTTTVIYTVTDE